MESLKPHRYLELRPGTLEAVREDVGLHRPGEMKEAVRILDEWVQQQKHFVKKDFPPEYLEATIVMSKGSLERAKLLLDKMCTIRTLMPKYFGIFDFKKDFEMLRGKSYLLALPRQTPEHWRMFVGKFTGKYGDPALMDCVYRFIYSSIDYLKLHDYNSGVVLIYDISGTDLKDAVANVNLMELRNCYLTLLESYGVRLKRVHLITASKVVDTLISFFKQFLKKKIMDRIVLHRSTDELLQHYDAAMLPKDYGGTERSLDELQDECMELLSTPEYRDYLKSMSEARVDETARPAADFNDLYAGAYGTFRTLTLD
ncbi:uncharacterized protein LOC121736661 [Aricia agestis]|uniref:uncharacterized protein LOC121736661 n=1 Tax=Aricia agestis TaxID=91739 RepID=UPI001C206783|nr:uncharacterized protein LOC121736661 [Aricia agestis]